MATYAIGDIQGCYTAFHRLLDRINLDPVEDRLWIAGDLVNRGPHSLETLRLVKQMGEICTVVLGNHDIHLLVSAAGHGKPGKGDTIDSVLRAEDRDELLQWLAARPLIHADAQFVMVHAGLLPQWSVAQALKLGEEVSQALTGPKARAFFKHMYGDKPDRWRHDLRGWDRLRAVVNAMTRMRVCTPDGRMDLHAKGGPDKAPPGTVPWFRAENRAYATHTVVCGHWSALGLYRGDGVIALDSGCVWGDALTAVRLDDGAVFQVGG